MSTLGDNGAGSWLGIAVTLTEIVAYDTRLKSAGGVAWRMLLQAPAADQLSWPSFATALRTLAQLTREKRGRLAIALMPGVAEVRRVDVPPLADDELEVVLSRNAARYFVGAQGAQLVAIAADNRSAGAGVVAAAAPAWLIRQISVAAREAGWILQHIAPAEAAWARALPVTTPSATRGDAVLLVTGADQTHALVMRDSAIAAVRRFRSAAAGTPVLVESLVAGARLIAAGEPTARKQWMQALGERAISVSLPASLPADVSNDAALLAAAFVVDADTFVFRTEEMRVADRRRRIRLLYALSGAAVLLLAASGAFLLWDVQRELTAVQAARAELKPQLATTLLGRSSVETVSGQLQLLAKNERESPHWSAIIADLTKHLPDDAFFTAFRGWGDSVRFDGLAERASTIYVPLSRAESLSGIKAAAAVRLEPQVDGSMREKFTLVGKLRPRVPAVPTLVDSAIGARPRTGAMPTSTKGAP